MTGLIIRGGNFTGAGSKPLLLDPILSVGPGSLLLVDVKNWDSGIPHGNAAFRNIARLQAAQVGLPATSDALFKPVGDFVGGGHGKIERTPRGGLHVMVKQSAAIAANQGYQIELPDSIMTYMLTHYTHVFYYSQWRKLTRAPVTTNPDGAKTFFGIDTTVANGGFARLSHVSIQEWPPGQTRLGRSFDGVENAATVGVARHAVAGPWTKGTGETTAPLAADYATGESRSVGQFGSVRRQNNYGPLAAALPSWIFYRAYIEDLTVSGRTYAEVDALDHAEWVKAFGTGGRFAGDTYTSPATAD